jgi:hypothetical protein
MPNRLGRHLREIRRNHSKMPSVCRRCPQIAFTPGVRFEPARASLFSSPLSTSLLSRAARGVGFPTCPALLASTFSLLLSRIAQSSTNLRQFVEGAEKRPSKMLRRLAQHLREIRRNRSKMLSIHRRCAQIAITPALATTKHRHIFRAKSLVAHNRPSCATISPQCCANEVHRVAIPHLNSSIHFLFFRTASSRPHSTAHLCYYI